MKYYQLLESVESHEFFHMLKSSCSQWINEVHKPYWRGLMKNHSPVFSQSGQRTSMTLPRSQAKSIDQQIFSNPKAVAGRQNSMFITPKIEAAANYGAPYLVFMEDGYHYTWSPEIVDAIAYPVGAAKASYFYDVGINENEESEVMIVGKMIGIRLTDDLIYDIASWRVLSDQFRTLLVKEL